MVHIDDDRCTGCGYCVGACQHRAITMENGVAVIHQGLCTQCGICIEVCPVGAIGELAPAATRPMKGGETMTYGYGRGFGFRGGSPAWPYIGRGRGGLPRCWHQGWWPAASDTALAGQHELGFLKDQADAMRRQLEDIERRIKELAQPE